MSKNPLGQTVEYISQYSPDLLFPIARQDKRDELDMQGTTFRGTDIWNAYELSWLNAKGLPRVAIGVFEVPSTSPNIIESKSFKLYLNSFNQSRYDSFEQVAETMQADLSKATGENVRVSLYSPNEWQSFQVEQLSGEIIDDLPVTIQTYEYAPDLLTDSISVDSVVEESLVSHLLKSNCLITSQPDWASIQIRYQGPQINHELLLAYLVSFRSHNEFHEQCVERIFCDLKRYCQPEKLSVYARYTRRGGLDINPWRSDFQTTMDNPRLARQ